MNLVCTSVGCPWYGTTVKRRGGHVDGGREREQDRRRRCHLRSQQGRRREPDDESTGGAKGDARAEAGRGKGMVEEVEEDRKEQSLQQIHQGDGDDLLFEGGQPECQDHELGARGGGQ